jgi:hypothetical protein
MRTRLRVSDYAPQETDCLSALLALADKRLQPRHVPQEPKGAGGRGRTAKGD